MAGQHILTVGHVSQLAALKESGRVAGSIRPRIAMIGRSNVGKSTLLNALLGARLAQTSGEPGKTRAIHFYEWKEGQKVLVDLPGYGFARASEQERNRWAKFIEAYIKADPGLLGALVLLDARHGPTDKDSAAIEFLRSLDIPIVPVFTKADTLKTQKERAKRKKETVELLHPLGLEEAIWVSATKHDGLGVLQARLREWKE